MQNQHSEVRVINRVQIRRKINSSESIFPGNLSKNILLKGGFRPHINKDYRESKNLRKVQIVWFKC